MTGVTLQVRVFSQDKLAGTPFEAPPGTQSMFLKTLGTAAIALSVRLSVVAVFQGWSTGSTPDRFVGLTFVAVLGLAPPWACERNSGRDIDEALPASA